MNVHITQWLLVIPLNECHFIVHIIYTLRFSEVIPDSSSFAISSEDKPSISLKTSFVCAPKSGPV
jgi:hypothetical protein